MSSEQNNNKAAQKAHAATPLTKGSYTACIYVYV